MHGIPCEVTEHCLKIKSEAKLVQQCLYCFDEEMWRVIGDEIASVLVVGFIKEVKHPE